MMTSILSIILYFFQCLCESFMLCQMHIIVQGLEYHNSTPFSTSCFFPGNFLFKQSEVLSTPLNSGLEFGMVFSLSVFQVARLYVVYFKVACCFHSMPLLQFFF